MSHLWLVCEHKGVFIFLFEWYGKAWVLSAWAVSVTSGIQWELFIGWIKVWSLHVEWRKVIMSSSVEPV